MSAHDWANEHPELAAELADVGREPPDLTAARGAALYDTLRAVVIVTIGWTVVLAGHLWWGWGSWALVLLGAVGAVLLGGLMELGSLVFRRVEWVNNITEEVRR